MQKQPTNAKMGVDARITSGASEILVLSVRDVEMSLGVAVLLGQAEINYVDLVATLSNPHEKVIGFDVTMNEGLGMNVLDAGDELVRKEENRLQREFSVAEVEQVLQTGTEQIENHSIIVAFRSRPTHEGDADTAGERLVHTSFILELWVLCFDTLELDSNLLARDDVRAYGKRKALLAEDYGCRKMVASIPR